MRWIVEAARKRGDKSMALAWRTNFLMLQKTKVLQLRNGRRSPYGRSQQGVRTLPLVILRSFSHQAGASSKQPALGYLIERLKDKRGNKWLVQHPSHVP